MKKVISFFVIVVCLFFTIQLTSCGDKTDSPEVPEIPENPENPRDEAYYDSYIETVENLASQLNNGTITTNGQLIEFAKNYDNFKSVTEHDGVVYLEFDGGWTYFVDFDGRTAVSPIAEEDIDFSEFDELLSELEEFTNAEPEDDSLSDVQESRAATNPEYLPSKFKVLYWGPFDNGADVSNNFDEACKLVKIDNKPVIEYKSIYGNQCSLNDLNKFCDYDLVIFATHGCKGGMPLVPNTMKGISSLTDRLPKGRVEDIECTAFDYNFLSKKLPALGNTVVWTLMCYSFCENSTMASVAKQKSAGDYFGATGPINLLNNFELFVPFIARLYKGALSADAFIPGASGGQGYEYTSDDEQVKGIFHHNGFDGVCFPFTSVYKPVDNHPVAVFQAPSGELDKVLKGNGSFKAGIEVKNTSTSKITKIELTSDNISASSHKDWEQIIDRNKYTFKTDGLEAGKYEYRSYIEFTNGDIKYSDDIYTFEIHKESNKYFELYLGLEYQANKKFGLCFNNEVENVYVVCDNNSELNVKYDKTNSELSFNAELGIHKYTFYYEGLLKEMNYPYNKNEPILYGGYIPDPVSIDFSKLRGRFNEVSLNKKGDDILTLPHIQNLKIDPDFDALVSIDLSGCSDLNSIGELNSSELKYLKLNNCKNLTEIGGFRYCTSLQEVDLGNCSKLIELPDKIFDKCSSLNSINLKGCSALSRIGFEAFKDCSSLKSIDFSGCSSIKHISRYAFCRCSSLKSINFNGCSNLEIMEHHAFMDCDALSSLDLSPCVKLKELAKEIFADCSSLSSINFNECLQLIESGAFSYCSKLNTLDLSGCPNLISIQSNAFGDCTNLSKVILPAKVISVYGAFRACPIKIAYCYSPNPSYGNPFPRNIDNYAKIYVPASSVGIYQENWGVWEEDNRGNRIRCLNIFPM